MRPFVFLEFFLHLYLYIFEYLSLVILLEMYAVTGDNLVAIGAEKGKFVFVLDLHFYYLRYILISMLAIYVVTEEKLVAIWAKECVFVFYLHLYLYLYIF